MITPFKMIFKWLPANVIKHTFSNSVVGLSVATIWRMVKMSRKGATRFTASA